MVLCLKNINSITPNERRPEYLMWDMNRDISLNVPELFLVAIKLISAANIKRELIVSPVKKENITPLVSCFERFLDVPIINGKKTWGVWFLNQVIHQRKLLF